MPYTFNAAADRYRSTESGRFVTRTDALAYVDRSLDAGRSTVEQYSRRMAAGDVSAADWHSRMREEIRGEYIRQYMLGRGGRGSMTQADWGRAGQMLREQYAYLDNFAAEVRTGTLSEAQIANRAQMYISSARDAYERGHFQAAREGGFTEERWALGEAEHCDDCVALAGRGWVELGELGTTPSAGATACKVNCKCVIEYR